MFYWSATTRMSLAVCFLALLWALTFWAMGATHP